MGSGGRTLIQVQFNKPQDEINSVLLSSCLSGIHSVCSLSLSQVSVGGPNSWFCPTRMTEHASTFQKPLPGRVCMCHSRWARGIKSQNLSVIKSWHEGESVNKKPSASLCVFFLQLSGWVCAGFVDLLSPCFYFVARDERSMTRLFVPVQTCSQLRQYIQHELVVFTALVAQRRLLN